MASRNSVPGRVHVGVGGWSYAPWRDEFYPGIPQSGELGYMATQLTSVEINSTFYGLQKPATFRRWRDATPDGFVFAVKAPRFVTHRRDLSTAGESITRFLESGVTELGPKLGPVNWQLPPGRRFDAGEMQAFLALLPARQGRMPLRHAIEVRDASFATQEFVQLARRHAVAIVTAGDSVYPTIADATAPFAYLRIMGTQERLRQGYSAAQIARWAGRIRKLAAGQVAEGLAPVATSPASAARPRDVYLYVISGAKRRNPAAALALLRALQS